jgi:Xaa-Pro aminopeptidase
MGQNRDLVLEQCNPAMELGFSLAEFKSRLHAIRQRMAQDNIDLLWLMAPESLYYVSGYTCEWYQAQSPKQWPATSGIAIHVDHDRFIMFDTPSERVMCRDRQSARRHRFHRRRAQGRRLARRHGRHGALQLPP